MIKNTTLQKLGETFLNAKSAILFPHDSPDGDAIGSCVALCVALRAKGVDCWVLLDEKIPAYIDFLANEFCTTDTDCVLEPDICACIDCSDDYRIKGRAEKFKSGKTCISIDHHLANRPYGDLSYIDSGQAATAQIVYDLICEMGVEIDREMANAIYTAISTDTGNFRYSNTTSDTHRIVTELFEIGIDHNDIIIRLYQSVDRREIELTSRAMSEMDIFADGRAAVTCVTREMLHKCGAALEDAENIINSLRDIKGVEIAAVLKENSQGLIKVSLRAKRDGDVESIARFFGGGGHIKAAGCTLNMKMKDALAAVKEEIGKAFA